MANLTNTLYPVKMFEYITSDVKTALGLSVLHYEHGHPLEIVQTIETMAADPASQAARFPLIGLYQDFDELRGKKLAYYEVSFHLIIALNTLSGYKAAERMTNNFIATLYPIYDQLLISIAKSGYFRETNWRLIQHTKTDRMYWGKNQVANDFIDAIEITNLKLNINTITSCP